MPTAREFEREASGDTRRGFTGMRGQGDWAGARRELDLSAAGR